MSWESRSWTPSCVLHTRPLERGDWKFSSGHCGLHGSTIPRSELMTHLLCQVWPEALAQLTDKTLLSCFRNTWEPNFPSVIRWDS